MNSSNNTVQCFNQMVIDNIDTVGTTEKHECPNCGNVAQEHSFECYNTGSVNDHSEINCRHCGYHYCDREECDACESRLEPTPKGYNECINMHLILDSIIEKLSQRKSIGTDWTFLKFYMHKNPNLIYWYDMIFNDHDSTIFTASQLVWTLQMKLLDARFALKIRDKINLAHLEL